MIILGDKLGDNLVAKSGIIKYHCEKCNYECSKIYNWNKHIATSKHNREMIGNYLVAESGKKEQKYSCEKCEKYFHTNAGLWKHSKKCNYEEEKGKSNEPTDKELMMALIKDNSELKNMVLDVCQKIQPINKAP